MQISLGDARSHMSSFVQSETYLHLRQIAEDLVKEWSKEGGRGKTLDEYVMASLRRDGRIEGVKLLLQEIEKKTK